MGFYFVNKKKVIFFKNKNEHYQEEVLEIEIADSCYEITRL